MGSAIRVRGNGGERTFSQLYWDEYGECGPFDIRVGPTRPLRIFLECAEPVPTARNPSSSGGAQVFVYWLPGTDLVVEETLFTREEQMDGAEQGSASAHHRGCGTAPQERMRRLSCEITLPVSGKVRCRRFRSVWDRSP